MGEPRHPLALGDATLLKQSEVHRGRRSGPGGQHRNKVETAIVIIHKPTGVRAEATERRSQEENRRLAIARLRVNLAIDVRASWNKRQPPSDLWQRRCVGGQIAVSKHHEDFARLLAEALDCLHAWEMDVTNAARQLLCSPSQLQKLLKREPRAWQWLGEQRLERGLRRLR